MNTILIYSVFAIVWAFGGGLTYRWIMKDFVQKGYAKGYLDWKFVKGDDGIWLTALIWPGFWLDNMWLWRWPWNWK